jgi:hypothetical protein
MHPSSTPVPARWRRFGVAVVLAGLLTTLSGCPVGEQRPAERSADSDSPLPGSPDPSRETEASTGLPEYTGPPAGGPRSTGPMGSVVAAVDLIAAAPGVFSRVEAAAAAPDGGIHVALSPVGVTGPPVLGTVRGASVTGSVPMTGVQNLWDMHPLADGTVVVTGSLRSADGRRAGYGSAVVDPATGTVRTTVVVPYTGKTGFAFGRSALAADGRTLYLFLSTRPATGPEERLVVLDAATGELRVERDLAAVVATASESPAGHELAGLVPQPDGGVTLVLDATPDPTRAGRIPTLVTLDARLDPVGDPVRVTSLAEQAQTSAVAAGVDGTTFLVAKVRDGAWVLAVPPGGGAGPVLASFEDDFDYALVVEPAQVWGLLPAREGARAVDLTTGELRSPVDVGCPGRDIRGVFPGADGASALLIGECNSPRTRTQMLWLLGP